MQDHLSEIGQLGGGGENIDEGEFFHDFKNDQK